MMVRTQKVMLTMEHKYAAVTRIETMTFAVSTENMETEVLRTPKSIST